MKPQHGFSLVELVMVLILLGILAALATPRLSNIGGYTLHGAGLDLLEAIRYAQQQSMTHSGASPFQIQITTSGFTVSQSGAPISNPLTGTVGYTQDTALWNGVSVSPVTGTISFNAHGLPSCSGGFAACSQAADSNLTLSLQKGSDTLSITLERFTGYAHIN